MLTFVKRSFTKIRNPNNIFPINILLRSYILLRSLKKLEEKCKIILTHFPEYYFERKKHCTMQCSIFITKVGQKLTKFH